jgi:hypothetical protein
LRPRKYRATVDSTFQHRSQWCFMRSDWRSVDCIICFETTFNCCWLYDERTGGKSQTLFQHGRAPQDLGVKLQSRCLPSPEDGNRSSFRNVVFFF